MVLPHRGFPKHIVGAYILAAFDLCPRDILRMLPGFFCFGSYPAAFDTFLLSFSDIFGYPLEFREIVWRNVC